MKTFDLFLFVFVSFLAGSLISHTLWSKPITPEQREEIELAVYEKELGRDMGKAKYDCNKLGGKIIVGPNKNLCIVELK